MFGKQIQPQDVIRLAEGEIDDPRVVVQVARAIGADPHLSVLYDAFSAPESDELSEPIPEGIRHVISRETSLAHQTKLMPLLWQKKLPPLPKESPLVAFVHPGDADAAEADLPRLTFRRMNAATESSAGAYVLDVPDLLLYEPRAVVWGRVNICQREPVRVSSRRRASRLAAMNKLGGLNKNLPRSPRANAPPLVCSAWLDDGGKDLHIEIEAEVPPGLGPDVVVAGVVAHDYHSKQAVRLGSPLGKDLWKGKSVFQLPEGTAKHAWEVTVGSLTPSDVEQFAPSAIIEWTEPILYYPVERVSQSTSWRLVLSSKEERQIERTVSDAGCQWFLEVVSREDL